MRRLICAALVLMLPTDAIRAELRTEFEAGQQFGFGFESSEVTRKRFYFSAKGEQSWDLSTEAKPDAGSISFNGALRAWGDFESEVDIRALSVTWNRQWLRMELGFQEIAWGETFGFFIADIVNPRDFRDVLFNEPAWTRLSVFALNTQVFLDKLTLQFVLTPAPRLNRLPEPVLNQDAFPITDFANSGEFGGRASYLFDSGFDIGLMYFRHWNRNPAVRQGIDSKGLPVLLQTTEKVDTLGLTASQSAEDWVFRMDSVVHFGQPPAFLADDSQVKTNWQVIAGADRTLGDSGRWGFQYHLDVQETFQHWASAMAQNSFWGRKIETEIFVFKGLDNADFWIQPKVIWFLGDTVSWAVRLDLLSGSENPAEGALPGVAKQDRFLSWISFRF